MKNIHTGVIDSNLSEVVLGNTKHLKQHLNQQFLNSDRTRVENLIRETEISIGQAREHSKTYQEKYDIFTRITESWVELWKQYKSNSDALELIESINHITDYSTAYAYLCLSLSYINEGKVGQGGEDLPRVVEGFSLLAEIIDVFTDHFSVSELAKIKNGARNAIDLSSRNATEYFDNGFEVSRLTTQLRSYSSLIISKIEEHSGISDTEFESSDIEIRPFGLCAGEFMVPSNFDEALPEEILSAFEG